jgi:purine-nucleoside phosphorylase
MALALVHYLEENADATMSDLFSKAQAAVGAIRERVRGESLRLGLQAKLEPRVGIILGSGLGGFASQVESAVAIAYAEIPNFPQSTVEGHAGRLVMGTIGGAPVAVLQGRVHAYEGYTMEQVTFPTRVLGLLGVRTLIVTNAAGGIRADIAQGSLVAISDHINLTGTNAALGPNEPRFACAPGAGERFFDMTAAYSPRLRRLAHAEAERQGIELSEGVYIAVLGPSYETPAEIRAFRTLGADMVGMSTVHEVIVARHMGIEVLGISLVTNAAAGVLDEPIRHKEVMEIGRRVERQFTGLLTALAPQIAAVS